MWIDGTHPAPRLSWLVADSACYVRLMRVKPSLIRAAGAMQGANTEAIRKGRSGIPGSCEEPADKRQRADRHRGAM